MNEKPLSIIASCLENLPRSDGKYLHWVTDIKETLPILMGPDPTSHPPSTFFQCFKATVDSHGNAQALRYKLNNEYVAWTYNQYFDDARKFAGSLVALGIDPQSTTNIIGFNSPQWFIGYAGTILAGCVPVGVYTTNNAEACEYIVEHSEASLILVQNEAQLKKYLTFLPKYPKIKALVVYWPGKELETLRNSLVYTWEEFLSIGKERDLGEADRRMRDLKPNQCASIVYTSGTTGPPKGVMLSHDNFIWTSKAFMKDVAQARERIIVSYLPLSHVIAQFLDLWCGIVEKHDITFADEKALSGSLILTLQETRPTSFIGVPRVYEKFEEALKKKINSARDIERSLLDWALKVGYEDTINQISGKPLSANFSIAYRLVLEKFKKTLGFDRCSVLCVGGAPISDANLNFFVSLNMPIMNLLGMSEGLITTHGGSKINLFSVGIPVAGSDLVVKDRAFNNLPRGSQGELCMRSRGRFMGYYKNEVQTKETIDLEGYIHSGDKGYIDTEGFVHITGRFKELLITAGGENIPPNLIENAVKEKCHVISNAFLIGDAKKYLTMLISLKVNLRPDGSPSQELAPEAVAEFKKIGVMATTVDEAIRSDEVHKFVQKIIDEVNKHATSRAQEIKRFKFIATDFSIGGGELTPTMKLKRKFVLAKYKAFVDELYHEPKL
jgi:long-chain-fatty-acid--CoA ligase ACSBG